MRSTTVRWTLSLAAALLVQTALVCGFFWWNTARHALTQIDGGLRESCERAAVLDEPALVARVAADNDADVHRNGYAGLFDAAGHRIAGNILSLPDALREAPPRTPIEAGLRRTDPPEEIPNPSRAIACPLGSGGLLVVGRDLDEQTYVAKLSRRAILVLAIPATVLAAGLGFLLSLRGQRRFARVGAAIDAVRGGNIEVRLPADPSTDAFGRLCRDVNGMLDVLTELMADLRGLGDDMAHELRTPLTRLRARLERGCQDAKTRVDFREAGEACLREIDQALAIVSAILRIRAVDEGKRGSAFTDVDLAAIARDAVELYAPIAEDRGVRLQARLDEPAWIVADRDLMMEAVANLVDNAVKFADADGAVEVAVRAAAGEVVVSVRDDGPGIALDEVELVTSRFKRGRVADRVDGHGIGLSLVKSIVKLHGFRFSVDAVDEGCQTSIACGTPAAALEHAARRRR